MKGLKMIDASDTAIEQLPDSIVHLKELVELNLSFCKKLNKFPEQLGDMEGLRKLDASWTGIEQLPDSFGRLINLVDLNLEFCENLTSLPNSIWKLELLEVLDLGYCSKLQRLPEQLETMKSVEELKASCTAIEEIPYSIGLLSRLRELNLDGCSNLESLPNSLRNLTSLANLYLDQKDTVRINLTDTVQNMKKLEMLSLRCNIRLWLPIILSFSSLKELTLIDVGESFSSTKPFSLTTLSNLQYLALVKCTSLGSSFPELPLNLNRLSVEVYATLEQLPDLSSFQQLTDLYIINCISLQSLATLPPHLVTLKIHDCTSLQHLPDLSTLKELERLSFIGFNNLKSVSLRESSLQVRQYLDSSFRADLPNTEIPEWLSYKSSGCTISLEIPPILGDNFLGIALCLVYKFKESTHCKYGSYIRAVIKNKTEGITNNYSIRAPNYYMGEVRSRIECIWGNKISVKSGDMIKVSFHTLLYSSDDDVLGEVKVKSCGVHVIQKTPSTPCIY